MYPFDADGNGDIYILTSSEKLGSQGYGSGYHTATQVLRDIGNWYHLIMAVDTTQGSASNRVKHYLNGSQITVWDSDSQPSQNDDSDVNNTVAHTIGGKSGGNYFDGYLAEFHLIDGQQLTPSDFGEVDEDYGHWKPIKYTGSHGTNGFYLDFADSSSLGNDASANSNDFTVTNITASDQVTDTPTNNFPVMNNLNNQPFATTFAEGNLEITTGGSGQEPSNMATFGMKTGKWYFEVYQKSGGDWGLIGIRSQQSGSISPTAKDSVGKSADGYALLGKGTHSGAQNLVNNNAYVSYGTAQDYGNGDVISVAVDLDNNKCYWAKNGTYINSGNPGSNSNGHSITAVGSTSSGEYFPCLGDYDASSYVFLTNFGQDGTFAGNITAGGNADGNGYGNFKYAVPSGFLALCSQNLPTPAVIPSEHFNTVLYSGTGSARSITGVGFQPDLHWLKIRAGESKSHMITDAVRGAGKYLQSDGSGAENTDTGTVSSFDSDGWSFGSATANQFNNSGSTYVAWCWKANGSGSSNEDGSINTTATSANTSAGFSISTYTGESGNGTVGHGLSKPPNLVIVKSRADADQWRVGSIQSLGPMDFTDYLKLNATTAITDEATTWNDTAPTSSVFSVGSDSATNHPGYTYVSYCFHDVEGYSKIGCYKGNANTDGTFVYTGFAPTWILIKRLDGTYGWAMHDNIRDTTNPITAAFKADDTEPETTISNGGGVDFLSNGFKIRDSGTGMNASGSAYLYYAIAEQPFKHSNAK